MDSQDSQRTHNWKIVTYYNSDEVSHYLEGIKYFVTGIELVSIVKYKNV